MRIVVRAGRYRRAIPSRVLRTGRDTTPVGSTSPASKTTTGRASGVAWTPRRSVGKRATRATRSRFARAVAVDEPLVALLVFPPGMDFLPALLGCFASGAVAVPAYPPDPSAALAKLRAQLSDFDTLARDADARIVITTPRTPPHTPPRARARRPRQPPRPRSTRQKSTPRGRATPGPFDGFPSSASSARATARSRADSTASSRREQVHRSPSTATFVSRPPTRSPASLSCSTRRLDSRPQGRPRPPRAPHA